MDTGSLVEKRLQLATDPLATAEQLAELAQSGDHTVLLALSQRPDVPREIREKLKSQIGSDPQLKATGGAYPRIHPTAVVSSSAQLGWRVTVGPYSIIHEDVIVGDDSTIGSHCEIGCPTPLAEGRPLEIGKGSLIRSHSVFYAGSNFGDQLVTGHRVTVREGTTAGQNLQIGTLSDIQGDCSIGDFVRFHSNVHIGKHSKVGNYVWIFPYVVLTNDPHPPSNVQMGVVVDDFVAIATMSVILPGVRLRKGVLVAAHSSVTRDADEDTVVGGTPAKFICETSAIKLKDGSGASAYPWRKHFHRGYPAHVVEQWLKEFVGAREAD